MEGSPIKCGKIVRFEIDTTNGFGPTLALPTTLSRVVTTKFEGLTLSLGLNFNGVALHRTNKGPPLVVTPNLLSATRLDLTPSVRTSLEVTSVLFYTY